MSYAPRKFSVVPSESERVTATVASTTREEYERMVAAGVFQDRRVELLDGVVYEITPQLSPHAATVMQAYEVLRAILPPGFSIRSQMPLDLGGKSIPEPDLAIVPGMPRDYYAAHPTGALLVVEVADTSPARDRKRKGPIYAKAGIQDYWIVNLAREIVEVYRDAADGTYQTRLILRRGDRITPLGFPGATIAIDDLLPLS